jgi:hypothetical protein
VPKPNDGEKEADFVKRCIPVLIEEGKRPDQAVAICHSMFRAKGSGKASGKAKASD